MNITDFFEYIKNTILSMRIPIDLIDIAIVSVIIYYTVKFIRDKRAAKLLIGLAFLLAFYLISTALEMNALNFILENVFQVGIIALMIVFQPELRSVLENVGSKSMSPLNRIVEQKDIPKMHSAIEIISQAADEFSESKTGALIVIERSTKLGDIESRGTPLKAELSIKLLGTVFTNKSPLHDGAAIISGNILSSAGCYLPLSNNSEQLNGVGTRHRAGLGISEVSDAVVVIVSEERGTISVALNGRLIRGYSKKSLKEELERLLLIPMLSKKQTGTKKAKKAEQNEQND